jgi:hypothetical protein
MILLAGMAAQGGRSTEELWVSSCAVFLLIAGAVSLGIASHLLANAPRR